MSAAEKRVSTIFYRGIRLERVAATPDALDRFEAPMFGEHFPMRIGVDPKDPYAHR